MKKLLCVLMACLMALACGAALAITEEEAIARAMEAVRAKLSNASLPLGNAQMYEVYTASGTKNGHWVYFEPKVLDYGLCVAYVNDEETRVARADEPGYTGDTLFERFQAVYGRPADWNQNVWLVLDKTYDALEVTELDAVLMKNTVYGGLSQAAVTREEAFAIALKDFGQPEARTHTGVLIVAKEGPVWKLRVMGNPACRLYEIDAITGAILDREDYKADNYEFDDPVKQYTLRRDYEPALVEHYGMEYIAAVAVSKAYGDMALDNPMLELDDEEGEYEVNIAGGRVEFRAQLEGLVSYYVQFGSDNMIKEVGVIPSTEELPQAVQSLIREEGLIDGTPADVLRVNCTDGAQYCFALSESGYWLTGYICRGEKQENWSNDISVTPLADHYGSLYFEAHDSANLRPDGKPWENAEGFDVVSAACGCRISYRYDGESFKPKAWVSPCNFEGSILWEDEHLHYFKDGSNEAADIVDMTGGYSTIFMSVDEIPPTPQDARRAAELMRHNIENLFPGYTLRSYSADNAYTEANASYTKVEDGRLHVRRIVYSRDGGIEASDCIPVPLSESLLSRLEREPFDKLLCVSGDDTLFRSEDALDTSRIPVTGRIVDSDLKDDSLILLTQEEDGKKRLHAVSMAEDGSYRVVSTGALPEDTYMDVFHTSREIALYWAQQYAGVSFLPYADGVWRLASFHNDTDGNDVNTTLRFCGVKDYDQWTPGQTDCFTVGSLEGSGLDGFDHTKIPTMQSEVSRALDRSGWAVVCNPDPTDRLHLRVQPQKGATSLGKFYNGTPVEILEETGEWCRVRIGLDGRLEGYMMKRYLAFGGTMDDVDCVFPQLTLREEYGELKAYMLPENAETTQLFGEVWIAGVVGEEWYVLVTDEGFTGYAPQEWFWEGNG